MTELQNMPEYQAFKKAVKQQLTADNTYVNHFMPETGKFTEVDKDGDKHTGYITTSQAKSEGIELLLEDDTGYFEEMVTMSDLAPAVVELARALIKEIANA